MRRLLSIEPATIPNALRRLIDLIFITLIHLIFSTTLFLFTGEKTKAQRD